MKHRVGFALISCIGAMAATAALPVSPIDDAISFKDIRYVTRTLKDFGEAKAYVLVFTSTTCPVAQRYVSRLNEMYDAYAGRGVQFVAVNVDGNDSIQDMAYFAMEYEIRYPVVKDAEGALVAAVKATRTPEVALLNGKRQVVYRGRIDDQYRVSGVQPSVTREDLKLAIEAVLEGKPVEVSETPVEGCEITFADVPRPSEPINFSSDIASILHNNCAGCHRPGTEAPFSLLTYEQAAAKAGAIAETVSEGRMPPWFAHKDFSGWANERRLKPEDKLKLLQWAKYGKEPGDLASAPEPPKFPDTQWIIGEPDLILTAEKPFELPADGIIDYQYVTMPYVFPEDTWVQGIQVQPSNPRVVHHANVVYTVGKEGYREDENFLTGRVPGGSPAILTNGTAFLIPKDAVLTVQIHYVTTGKPETDQMSVAIRYAKEPIRKRARHKVLSARGFTIPPGEAAHPVAAEKIIECDVEAVALFVHMHLRGKNTKFYAHYPDGTKETLLVIPNYSFDWQMPYLYPPGAKRLPAGTRIECVSHFDNSAFNPFNPDPTATVEYGPQTFHEMMDGYIFYLDEAENLNIAVDPKTGQEISRTARAEAP